MAKNIQQCLITTNPSTLYLLLLILKPIDRNIEYINKKKIKDILHELERAYFEYFNIDYRNVLINNIKGMTKNEKNEKKWKKKNKYNWILEYERVFTNIFNGTKDLDVEYKKDIIIPLLENYINKINNKVKVKKNKDSKIIEYEKKKVNKLMIEFNEFKKSVDINEYIKFI